MDFSGRYLIPASPDVVWNAIQDPDVLKACIPGCETLTKTSDTTFEAVATLKIGPVKASFKGKVELTEMDPPHRCVLKGEGQGGVAGFARGQAEVKLSPEPAGTALTYTAKANVGGKLAQIGQRLVDGAAKQIADDFFARFVTAITPEPMVLDVSAAAPGVASAEAAGIEMFDTSPAENTPPTQPGAREGLRPELWVVGLIGVIVILLILFGLVL
ncbi:MAG: carbon monoxide dehydrogenase subunit G [Alphaproteobacteria bacterium]|nr:carbon monoxide dehydrogenase subunit G [Alphaproteobacteria bacterium]